MAALLRSAAGPLRRSLVPSVAASSSAFTRVFATPSVKLYQYEICPFCCKLKAFLDWQQIGYQTVEVNPLTKAEIKFSEKYRKVPIAMLDDQQVNDSVEIMSQIAAQSEEPAIREAMADPETVKWLQWCDKELAVLLFPNITRSMGESWQAFRYISEVPTFGFGAKLANQFAGSVAMCLANGRLKKKYNITDERKQLAETVQVWLDAVGQGPFLKGEQLSVSDVAVYGVISAVRGLKAHADLMESKPALQAWSDRVRSAIGESRRIEAQKVVRTYGPTAA